MRDFDAVFAKFQNGELSVDNWNFCTHSEGDGTFSAYIMGEGTQQCLAMKGGFDSCEAVETLFRSLGVKYILAGVG